MTVRVQPFNFKEFVPGVASQATAGGKTFLPGGRRRGEGSPLHPPVFNEEQLKAAQAESYKKGFLEGTEEGKKQQDSEQALADRKLADALDNVGVLLSRLMEDYRTAFIQMQQDMPKAALAIAHKVAGKALAENAPAMVEETAMKCVEMMIGQPKLVITVHATLAEALKKNIEALAARQQHKNEIVVAADDALPATDYRIEWKHGAFARDTEKLWQEIGRVVENMSASAKHNAETQMNNLQQEAAAPQEPPTKKE